VTILQPFINGFIGRRWNPPTPQKVGPMPERKLRSMTTDGPLTIRLVPGPDGWITATIDEESAAVSQALGYTDAAVNVLDALGDLRSGIDYAKWASGVTSAPAGTFADTADFLEFLEEDDVVDVRATPVDRGADDAPADVNNPESPTLDYVNRVYVEDLAVTVEKAAKRVVEAYMAGDDIGPAISALEIACGFNQQGAS
jgi:hypothetical protein